MTVTIKDVAKETNLAISTISKYMNGGNVQPQNKKIIEEAVQRLGYHPNDIARGLRSTKTKTVGIVITRFDDHMVSLINGIERVLRKEGYFPIICSHREKEEKAQSAIKFLVEKQVDGAIVEGRLTSEKYISSFQEKQIPVVGMEAVMDQAHIDYVMVDSVTSSYLAVEELVKKGHIRIGIITGMHGYYTSEERLRGYLRVLEDYGIKIQQEYIVEGDYSYQSGYDGMIKLWSLPVKPTAVFICNYYMCVGAISAINYLGIKIPDELSFVTFDDMDFSLVMRPHLSSVKQPFEEIGEKASQILIKRMNGDYSDFPRKVRLKGQYIARDSVKKIVSDYNLL